MLRAFSPLAIVAILLTGAGASGRMGPDPAPQTCLVQRRRRIDFGLQIFGEQFRSRRRRHRHRPAPSRGGRRDADQPALLFGRRRCRCGVRRLLCARPDDAKSSAQHGIEHCGPAPKRKYGSVGAATALLYGYGLYSGESRARQCALTAGEGAGIAALVDIGIKAAFGRLRPSQSSSHTAFFHGGQSFVSGDMTPMFALADRRERVL
jgi:hypothetical protein